MGTFSPPRDEPPEDHEGAITRRDAQGMPMGGPIHNRIVELDDVINGVIDRIQPQLDFVQEIRQYGFTLKIFGYTVLTLKVTK